MATHRPRSNSPTSRLIQTTCPKCQSDRAVVAAAHYGEFLCFCPACEHVWDCDAVLFIPPVS